MELSPESGRDTVLFLGGLYTGLAVVDQFLLALEGAALGVNLLVVLLVGGPGVVLLYAGYRLPETDVRPEFYPTIATWCLAAVGLVLAILGLVELAAGLRDPVENVLILTALASTAGLVSGHYDARAKSRARDLEVRNRELERTKTDLQASVERLQTANERLERFTYATSHDLQEPLRMVSSYLQLLESRYADDLDDDAREFIAYAVGGADRMRTMIDSLRKYAEVSTDGDPLEPTDAAAVLDDVRADLRADVEAADATITADDLPTVSADAEQLALLFENLLANALANSGDEPPRIHVGVRKTTESSPAAHQTEPRPADAEREAERWLFSVADEGVGIDPAFHDRVFQVFENLGPTERDAGDGSTGIGLALCERIVERHGGDVWVESTPGEGATFYFTLPPADTARDDSAHRPVAAE